MNIKPKKPQTEHTCKTELVHLGRDARWCPECAALERTRDDGTRYWRFPGGIGVEPKQPITEHPCDADPVRLGREADGARWCPHCGALERMRTGGKWGGHRYWTFPGKPVEKPGASR